MWPPIGLRVDRGTMWLVDHKTGEMRARISQAWSPTFFA